MKRFVITLISIFLFTSSSYTQEKKPQTLDQLIDSIQLEMKKNHIPGLLISIVKEDSILYSGGLGFANLTESIPVEEHHLFRMGSITKSFGALSMILLEREGKINLDAPLREIAPEIEFKNKWEKTHPLTIRNLLHHTSGFDDMRPGSIYNWEDKEMSAIDLVQSNQNSLHCRWKPGTRLAYSNPNYQIIGYLIEKISGIPFQQYVDKNIFTPLGMELSNLNAKMDSKSNYSTAYQWDIGTYKEIGFRNIKAGLAGSLNSNAKDMTRFLQFFIGDGTIDSIQVFSPEEISYMETPATTYAAKAGLAYGYGLGNYSSNYGNKIIFHGHSGGIDGYASDYSYNREYDLGYALSNNAGRSLSAISSLIKEYLTKDIPKPEPASKPIDISILEKYEGYYRNVSPRNKIANFMERLTGGNRLLVQKDTLYLKSFMEDPQKLIHTGDKQFRYAENNYPTIILLEKEDNKLAYSNKGGLYEKNGFWKILLLRVLIFGSIIIIIIMLPVTLIWLIMALFKKIRKRVFRRLLIPMSTLVFFLLTIISLNITVSDLFRFAKLSLPSISFVTISILFAIFSIITLWNSFKNKKKIKSKLLRIYYYTVGIAFSIIAVYLTLNGIIGYRIWIG
jgi:CubicO group peptidase (beta-lactamase class C family)